MSKDLVFFDKEGNYINANYNQDTELHQADLIFHENSSDTFKTIGLYTFENIKAFDFNAPDELFLSKFQLFNEYGFDINGSSLEEIIIEKIEPTNQDAKFYSKWIYAKNIEKYFTIGSSLIFLDPIAEFTNPNQTYTVLNYKRGAVMIISNEHNLLYTQNNATTVYDNIRVSGINFVGIKNYFDQNLNNLISTWSERNFYDMVYNGRKINLTGTQFNNSTLTINNYELLDKINYNYTANVNDITADLTVTINLKTSNSNIYYGSLLIDKNTVYFTDGVPDTLLPGRLFKVDTPENPYYVTVAQIEIFTSNKGERIYSPGDQVMYNKKIYQCYVQYTQDATSIITPDDQDYWSDNITYIKTTTELVSQNVSANVYLGTNTFVYKQAFLDDNIKTAASFVAQYQEEFKLFNIDLSITNHKISCKLDYADKWAEIEYKSANVVIGKEETTIERLLATRETLVSERCDNISKQFKYNIVFTDVDDYGILITINGMPYAEPLVPIYNGGILNLERSIDKTLRNWLSKNYIRLFTLGVTCVLKSSQNLNSLYYNTICLNSFYPNVPIDFEVQVGTTAAYHIEDTMITFKDMGNILSIVVNDKTYSTTTVLIDSNTPNIILTLQNWVSTYKEVMDTYGIKVSSTNNILFFNTLEQHTLDQDIVVNTSKLNIPGDELYMIKKTQDGNIGAIITSNSIVLKEDSALSFEDFNFATGMIVGINNTNYPFNNQNYNILSVDPHTMNLSYQGPFWDTDGNSCLESPFITIAFNNGFESQACTNTTPIVLSGEFNNDFNSTEYLLEYIPGNQYNVSTYPVEATHMVDILYLGISNNIYILGDNITVINSLNNTVYAEIVLNGNNTNKRVIFNPINNYVHVLASNKLYTIDPILNSVLVNKTITLSYTPNDIDVNLYNGDIYITSDNGVRIYDLNVNYIKVIGSNKSTSLCYNYYDMDMYVITQSGIIRIDGATRLIHTTFNISPLLTSQIIFDPYNLRVYAFTSTKLYYIENNVAVMGTINSLTKNYILHNNLSGDIITNTDFTVRSRGENNFDSIVNAGKLYMNQYDGYIYLTTSDGTHSVVVINSVSGRVEEITSLSNDATKLVFNPDRNSMVGFQTVDNKVLELTTNIKLDITTTEEIESTTLDNQFGSLSPSYVKPLDMWINTLDYIRKPRANYEGDVTKTYKWKWEDDTIPEIFLYDFSGDQLDSTSEYKYTGEKPLTLITLIDKPNKDINKCDKPQYQQTVFSELKMPLDYIDSKTNVSFLPKPMEIFIGYNDIEEGVKSSNLLLFESENITIDYTNNGSNSDILSIQIFQSTENGMYGIIQLDNNSDKNFLEINDAKTGLKSGQLISIILTDTTNVHNKYISMNNHLEFKIKEVYPRILTVYFTNGTPSNESNTLQYEGKTLYLNTKLKVLDKKLAAFNITGQTEIEDIRFKMELDNVGQNISVDDTYIFKEYDINEQGIDWKFLNSKRKELLINRHDIFPYLGSYKAIINAINYFGYNDLELYEYYRNINPESTAFGTLTKVEIPDIFDNSVKGWNESDYLKQTFPNANYEDTNLFNLAYRITDKEGNNILSYSLNEVLVKLQGLKYWLQDNVIPMTHTIMDITGRADFVNDLSISHKCYDIKATNIREDMSPVDLNVNETYLMPVNSGSTVYDVVVDFSSNGTPPEYFTVDITTFKTEKEWSPFYTYALGDRVSYYNYIYESVIDGKNRVRDPRKYSNSSTWNPEIGYKVNDIVKYRNDYYQWVTNTDSYDLEVIDSPQVDTINWRVITEWKEIDYQPVQTIKEFRTSFESMHVTVDSNLDPYLNIVVTSENGYGQNFKVIKNYEIRGTKDLTDNVSIIEADPLPIRLIEPDALVPPTTTTTTTTTTSTTSTTTTTTTLPPDCSIAIDGSAVEITTTTTTTTTTSTTTLPPDCSFPTSGTANEVGTITTTTTTLPPVSTAYYKSIYTTGNPSTTDYITYRDINNNITTKNFTRTSSSSTNPCESIAYLSIITIGSGVTTCVPPVCGDIYLAPGQYSGENVNYVYQECESGELIYVTIYHGEQGQTVYGRI